VQRVRRELGIAEDEAWSLRSVGFAREGSRGLDSRGSRAGGDVRRAALSRGVGGDGPERERLARLASQLALRNGLSLPDSSVTTKPYYAMATAMAVPSYSEGSPNVRAGSNGGRLADCRKRRRRCAGDLEENVTWG